MRASLGSDHADLAAGHQRGAEPASTGSGWRRLPDDAVPFSSGHGLVPGQRTDPPGVCDADQRDGLREQCRLRTFSPVPEVHCGLSPGLSAGADDYVRKPFEPVELLSRLRTHYELAQEHSRRLLQAQQTATQLQIALTSNRQIGVAVGVLMAREKVTSERAFDLLRVRSNHTNRKLRDVAEEVALTGQLPQPPTSSAAASKLTGQPKGSLTPSAIVTERGSRTVMSGRRLRSTRQVVIPLGLACGTWRRWNARGWCSYQWTRPAWPAVRPVKAVCTQPLHPR